MTLSENRVTKPREKTLVLLTAKYEVATELNVAPGTRKHCHVTAMFSLNTCLVTEQLLKSTKLSFKNDLRS